MKNVFLKASLIFGFTGLVTLNSLAQNVLPCGTQEMVDKAFEENPALKLQYENSLKNQNSILNQKNADSVLIIPTVVHIIHNFGSENITEAQVYDAMRILNEDFAFISFDTGQIDPNFKPIASKSIKVQFRLVRLDPNGNCTNGITRTVSELTNTASNNVKDLISWNTTRYLNIWVANNVFSGSSGNQVGGFAYYPGTAPSSRYEGVIVTCRQFGSIGQSSSSNFSARTLTHEVGHYLNLAHTWGNSNTPGAASNCNIDDGVADTPNTVGIANQSCNKSFVSCGLQSNVENYMDYSSCGRMFTLGQSTRMRNALNSGNGGRNNLWTINNRVLTGTNNGYNPPLCSPKADFFSPQTKQATVRNCKGSSITLNAYISNSSNDPQTQYFWKFPGGTPSTSTARNPSVTYANSGLYSVSLKVKNQFGEDSSTKSNFISVSERTPIYSVGESEDFSEVTFPNFPDASKNWQIVTKNQNQTWRRSTTAFASQPACLSIQNRNLASGTENEIITPIFDASSLPSNQSVYLRFKIAFARRNDANSDILNISTSTTCGATWSSKYNKTANSATANQRIPQVTGNITTVFVPNDGDWQEETVNLLLNSSQRLFSLKFGLTSGGGNNMYIDDISIGTLTALDKPLNANPNWQIYPNPANDEFTVNFGIEKNYSKGILTILNTSGQTIKTLELSSLNAGDNQITFSRNQLGNVKSGLYYLQITIDGVNYTKKLVLN